MKKETISTFSGGLNYDLNPITTPNNVLTDSVNGTFITFNGDELALQNDAGNTKILVPKTNPDDPDEYVQLSEEFYPLGVKEEGGVLYIVSGKTQNATSWSNQITYTTNNFVYDSSGIYYKSLTLNNTASLPIDTDLNWEVIGNWNEFANKYGEIEFGSYPSPYNMEKGIIKSRGIDLDLSNILYSPTAITDSILNLGSSIVFNNLDNLDVSNISFQGKDGNIYKKIYKIKLWQVVNGKFFDLTEHIETKYKEFRKTINDGAITTTAQAISTNTSLRTLTITNAEDFPDSGFVTINSSGLNYVFRYTSKSGNILTNSNIPTSNLSPEHYFPFNLNSGAVVNQLANYWFADTRFRYNISANSKGYLAISAEFEEVSLSLNPEYIETSTSVNKQNTITLKYNLDYDYESGTTYDKGVYVWYNKAYYLSLIANNSSLPNSDYTKWKHISPLEFVNNFNNILYDWGTLILGNSLINIPYTNTYYNEPENTVSLTLLNDLSITRSFDENYEVYTKSPTNFYFYRPTIIDSLIFIIVDSNYPTDIPENYVNIDKPGYFVLEGSYNRYSSSINDGFSPIPEKFSYKKIVKCTSSTYKELGIPDSDFSLYENKYCFVLLDPEPQIRFMHNIYKDANNLGAGISFAKVSRLAEPITTNRRVIMSVKCNSNNLLVINSAEINLYKNGLTITPTNNDAVLYASPLNGFIDFDFILNYYNTINYTITPNIKFLQTKITDEVSVDKIISNNYLFPEIFRKPLIINGVLEFQKDSFEYNGYYLGLDKYEITADGKIIYYQITLLEQTDKTPNVYINKDGNKTEVRKQVIIIHDYKDKREYGTDLLGYIVRGEGESWFTLADPNPNESDPAPTLNSDVSEIINNLLYKKDLIFYTSDGTAENINKVLLHITTSVTSYITVIQQNEAIQNQNPPYHTYNVLKDVPIYITIRQRGFETINYTTTINSETTLNFGLIASIEATSEYVQGIQGINYYWSFLFDYNEPDTINHTSLTFTTDVVQGSGGSDDLGKNVTLPWISTTSNYKVNQGLDTFYAAVALIPTGLSSLSETYVNISNNSNYLQRINDAGSKIILKNRYTFIV